MRVGKNNQNTRETWLEAALARVPAGSRILDAGAGELQYKRFCGHLDYVAQDFGEYDGSGDGQGLQTESWDNSRLDIVSDITAIPVEDSSFDAVMCIEVLEHVPDPVAALNELKRVLRPGGTMIVTAPFCSLTHFGPYHFSTGFNRYFYEQHLEGFDLLAVDPNGNYFEYIAQEIRRVRGVAKKYAPAGRRTGLWHKVLSWMMLRQLERLSKHGDESSDLLCFGYHVEARKRAA